MPIEVNFVADRTKKIICTEKEKKRKTIIRQLLMEKRSAVD